MTRQSTIISVIIAMSIMLVVALIMFKSPSPKTSLGVVLRCLPDVSGSLSISTVPQDQSVDSVEETFDLKTVCKEGQFDFNHYLSQKNVLFIYKKSHGEITTLVSEYGADIQVDNYHGFYVVIAVTGAPPFMSNDRL